jgi:preprotein translocase subunit SecY
MSKTCNGCGSDKLPSNVPYVVHESAMARAERQNKRLVWVIVLLIVLLVGSNIGWLVYESQFETVESWEQEVVQEADNGENHFIGGDFIGETESKN